MFLFGPYGEPLRNAETIRSKIISSPPDYEVVPEGVLFSLGSIIGYYMPSYMVKQAVVTDASGEVRKKRIVLKTDQILVADTTPERFRPIVAAHEAGHRYGLCHREILALELGVADRLAETTSDSTLKADYVRWISDERIFRKAKGCLGQEENENRVQIAYHLDVKTRNGADAVFYVVRRSAPEGFFRETFEEVF